MHVYVCIFIRAQWSCLWKICQFIFMLALVFRIFLILFMLLAVAVVVKIVVPLLFFSALFTVLACNNAFAQLARELLYFISFKIYWLYFTIFVLVFDFDYINQYKVEYARIYNVCIQWTPSVSSNVLNDDHVNVLVCVCLCIFSCERRTQAKKRNTNKLQQQMKNVESYFLSRPYIHIHDRDKYIFFRPRTRSTEVFILFSFLYIAYIKSVTLTFFHFTVRCCSIVS